jgi:hypothetical protein
MEALRTEDLAIQIVPALNIDDKYTTIITDSQNRVVSFVQKAMENGRIDELFELERSGLDQEKAKKILMAEGRLAVGFQFEASRDDSEENFQVFVRKVLPNGKGVKFYLSQTVQDIMLQLISLEDRRTLAIFSMLSSAMDVGYRILTALFGNQLRRLVGNSSPMIREKVQKKLDKLKMAKNPEDSDLWKDADDEMARVTGVPKGDRPGSQDNILQVMADDGVFAEINQYVENVKARSSRIHEKRRQLEENPDMDPAELYERMLREDLEQLENCYARMHIYLKAFYKNKDRRTQTQNRVLRQFFGSQIEEIHGDSGVLEDLLSLNQDEYFKNIARHSELET